MTNNSYCQSEPPKAPNSRVVTTIFEPDGNQSAHLDNRPTYPPSGGLLPMRKLDDGDGLRPAHLGDLVAEFQIDVDYLDRGNIDTAEWELITNQYAYIKFGLILEKIRNQSWWKKCSEKFSDFRSFCQTKVNLNIWQVNSAIDSARLAVRLVGLGFTELPRNASQALKLAKLSLDDLARIWGGILENYQGHKITALAIESAIDPDKESKVTTLRLPKRVVDSLQQQAIAAGMTLNDYLADLADPAGEDNSIESIQVNPLEVNEEQLALLDRVEYQWLKPAIDSKKFLERSIESFDRVMSNLLGYYPKSVGVDR
jgi:hypothetical protein